MTSLDLSSLHRAERAGSPSSVVLQGCSCPSMLGVSGDHSYLLSTWLIFQVFEKKKRSQKQFKLGTRHNKEFINKWTLVNFHPDGHSTWVELHEWHGTSFPWFHLQCRAMRRTTWQQALATVQFLKDDHPWPLQSQRLQACLCKNVLLKHPHTLLYVSGYFHTPGRSWVAATKSVGFTRLKLNFLFSGSFLLTLFMNLGPKVGFCFLVPRCWCITSVDLTQGRPFPPLISVFHP